MNTKNRRAVSGYLPGLCRLAGLVLILALILPKGAVALEFTVITSFGTNAISADGNIVVGGNKKDAFMWTKDQGVVNLGRYSLSSSAQGVTNDGIVAGTAWTPVAFIKHPGKQIQPIGYLNPSSDPGTYCHGISDDGTTVVGIDISLSHTHEAFAWTREDGMTRPEHLPERFKGTNALAVSGDGSMVTGLGAVNGLEAFIWDRNTGILEGLGFLGSKRFSSGHGISADGSVVVGRSAIGPGSEAFAWTRDGGMKGLGELEGGEYFSAAHDVSADGSVIVGMSNSARGREAVLWTDALGIVNLNDYLAGLGLDLNGYVLTRASAVSDDGLTIIGGMTKVENGPEESFELKHSFVLKLDSLEISPVPVPGTLLLLGTGMAALAGLGRKKNK